LRYYVLHALTHEPVMATRYKRRAKRYTRKHPIYYVISREV
jgi:hypothetical protein